LSEVSRDLIDNAIAFDDDQAARAKEFELQYERVMGKKLQIRDPVSWAWLRKRMEPLRYSTCLPGRIMPRLVFGDVGIKHSGYIPIERRFVLTNTRFGEILAAGDKTPKRNMVELK
jgi:hypothetical protein